MFMFSIIMNSTMFMDKYTLSHNSTWSELECMCWKSCRIKATQQKQHKQHCSGIKPNQYPACRECVLSLHSLNWCDHPAKYAFVWSCNAMMPTTTTPAPSMANLCTILLHVSLYVVANLCVVCVFVCALERLIGHPEWRDNIVDIHTHCHKHTNVCSCSSH